MAGSTTGKERFLQVHVMNREIVIGLLKEHTEICSTSPVSNRLNNKDTCSFCQDVNRDTLLLITKMPGARKSFDVGIAIDNTTRQEPYKPYQTAGFKLFRRDQTGGIKSIFQNSFTMGYKAVVIISHGVPNIPPMYLENALKNLRNGASAVFGPLMNGTFYLVGMTLSEYRNLVDSGEMDVIDFEDNDARERSVALIMDSCNHCHILPEWYRVKKVEDLQRLHDDFENGIGYKARWTNATASVII